jgi:TonB family protein
MILPVMVFLALVSLVAFPAAWLAEAGLRRIGAPARVAWLVALALGPLLLLLGLLPPLGGLRAAGGGPVVLSTVELPALFVGAGSGASLWGTLPALVWLFASGFLVVSLVRAHRALRRERSGWVTHEVRGRTVLVSSSVGPAIAGVLRPRIVLPRWALHLPDEELDMVLLHEEEHVRAWDSGVLAAGLALVVLTAWNPLAWWQHGRLKQSTEEDCDARVLRRAPDRGLYGKSLLSVAARVPEASLALAAFTESSRSLRRRILLMTSVPSRLTVPAGILMLAVGVIVGVQACGVDNPMAPEEPTYQAVEIPTPAPDISAAPTFTPFTIAPSILNRDEVISAMESNYPPLLKDAGIGGTVKVYFFIDETGTVQDTRVDVSSGHQALDEAALSVAGVFRFSPALNQDEGVPVWVSFPITFQVR